jgi:hypothetical protein
VRYADEAENDDCREGENSDNHETLHYYPGGLIDSIIKRKQYNIGESALPKPTHLEI